MDAKRRTSSATPQTRRRDAKALGVEVRLVRAMRLLEALSGAPAHAMSVEVACTALGCDTAGLQSTIELIDTLSDRSTGARAVVYIDGEQVKSLGSAAQLMPIRLTGAQAASLVCVLDTLRIGTEARERIAEALLPEGWRDASPLVASTVPYGAWFQPLAEAIADGARCRITYRAHSDQEPRTRLVDPIDIETSGDAAYLIAWNVELDEGRRYRLDRIGSVEVTEDSVVPHAWTPEPIAASLADEPPVMLGAARGEDVPAWATPVPAPEPSVDDGSQAGSSPPADGGCRIDGMVFAIAHVESPRWLFDQLLSRGGGVWIVAPASLAEEFVRYARELV